MLNRNILIKLLFCAVLIACKNNNVNDKVAMFKTREDTISFCIVEKDSVRLNNYLFKNKNNQQTFSSFEYKSDKDQFSIFCDTSKKIYKGVFDKNDTIALDIEKTKFYTINGNVFRIEKLIGNKNVQDGSFSVFISPDFGLLLSRSNTWRTAKVICPDRNNINYIVLISLLYKIETDNDFYSNSIPDINLKFTPPKFE